MAIVRGIEVTLGVPSDGWNLLGNLALLDYVAQNGDPDEAEAMIRTSSYWTDGLITQAEFEPVFDKILAGIRENA